MGVVEMAVDETAGEAKRKRLLYSNYNAGIREIQSEHRQLGRTTAVPVSANGNTYRGSP
jgi:hypothetical protein